MASTCFALFLIISNLLIINTTHHTHTQEFKLICINLFLLFMIYLSTLLAVEPIYNDTYIV